MRGADPHRPHQWEKSLRKFSTGFEFVTQLVRFFVRRGVDNRLPQVAGSLAFTTLLSLVPLLTVAFALFTAFPMFSTFQGALQGFLSNHLLPSHLNQQIFAYLNQFAAKAKGLTAAGGIFLLITAVMTMMTIESAFNVIWHVRRERPLAQRVLAYWAILTFGPLFIGVSLTISSYLFTHSLELTGVSALPAGFKFFLVMVTLPLEALTLTLLYIYLPNCPVAWRDAATGGLFAAIAFEIAKRAFGYYIRHIPTYTAVYGAFATIPIFLLWMYLSWIITLAGALIASALPAIRIGHFQRLQFPGSDLLDALDLLSRLAGAQHAGRAGYTSARLARLARCDLETAQRLLNTMEDRGWIARLQNLGDRAPRYVILANPERLKLAEMMDVLVTDPHAIAARLQYSKSHIDGALLLSTLRKEGQDVSLADLTAQRRAAFAASETGEAPERTMSALLRFGRRREMH